MKKLMYLVASVLLLASCDSLFNQDYTFKVKGNAKSYSVVYADGSLSTARVSSGYQFTKSLASGQIVSFTAQSNDGLLNSTVSVECYQGGDLVKRANGSGAYCVAGITIEN